MLKMVLKLLYLCLAFQAAFGIKWKDPLDRTVYGVEGQPLTITWELDLEDEEFFSGTWFLGKSKDDTGLTVIVTVNRDILIRANPSFAESTQFGEIKLKSLDSGYMKVIKAEAKDVNLDKASDCVFISYLGAPASFNQSDLQPSYEMIEDTNSSKNFQVTVQVQGDPEPTVYWTLNDQDVRQISDFEVIETKTQVGSVFYVTSVLTVKQLMAKDNGELKVIAKHGQFNELSPMDTKVAVINVKYPPKDLVVAHNVSSGTLYDKGHVKISCHATSNPPANFIIKEGSDTLYNGSKSSYVVYIDQFHSKRQFSYICIADNGIGTPITSNPIGLQVKNGTVLAKKMADEDTEWWIYFGVGVAVLLLIFLGVSLILCVIRRRQRSMNLRHDIDKIMMRKDYDGRTGPRSNGANHVYDMNERGKRGTATQMANIDKSQGLKTRPPITYDSPNAMGNGEINDGFDVSVYDTLGNR